MKDAKKGLFLVLATAVISGISIFINKFGVSGIEPSLFAGLKNLSVGLFIVSLIILSRDFVAVKQLKFKDWCNLFLVGLIGGSVPFILFFNGLAQTSAAKAGFIQKTMFIYVAVLAVLFLKEKVTKKVWLGLGSLFIGQLIFLQVKPQAINFGDFLVLLATMLWAIEIMISKNILAKVPANIVAASRMGFGGVFIWVYLLLVGKAQLVFSLSVQQFAWVAITTIFLIGYVLTFYHGLKFVSAIEATSLLAVGAPITLLLSVVWSGANVSWQQIIGTAVMLGGLGMLIKFSRLKVQDLTEQYV